jgi:hypothetical protein
MMDGRNPMPIGPLRLHRVGGEGLSQVLDTANKTRTEANTRGYHVGAERHIRPTGILTTAADSLRSMSGSNSRLKERLGRL